jgi:exodeoxyribonuclease-5
MSITLTPEQQAIGANIRAFIKSDDPNDRSHVTFGLAGTGKTTLLSDIVQDTPTDHLVTMTGKAASVLRAKGCKQAQTCHSLIYNLRNKKLKEDGSVDLFFAAKLKVGALTGHVIYLHECSMVSTYVANDFLRSGARIVAFGDNGQLPPVQAQQYFTKADDELFTIHRQALESAIIRQAHNIRATCSYKQDGDDFKVRSKVTLDEMAEADMVLCFTRRTADKLNASIRAAKGYNLPYPMAGEQLLCLKNAPKFGLYNGAIYTLVDSFPHVSDAIMVEVDGDKVLVPKVMFNAKTDKVNVDDDATSQFSYANALTVHKSQGSEWDKVVLVDECRQGIRREWLYTGVTRAAKSIIVQG